MQPQQAVWQQPQQAGWSAPQNGIVVGLPPNEAQVQYYPTGPTPVSYGQSQQATSGQVIVLQQHNAGRWQTHFCDFWQHLDICCISMWVPCLRLGLTSSRSGQHKFMNVLLGLGILYFICFLDDVLGFSFTNRHCPDGSDFCDLSEMQQTEPPMWQFVLGIVARFAMIAALVYRIVLRGALRRKYAIQGDCFSDCCLHFWCGPCTMTQEAVHVDLVELGQVSACDCSVHPVRAPAQHVGVVAYPAVPSAPELHPTGYAQFDEDSIPMPANAIPSAPPALGYAYEPTVADVSQPYRGSQL